MKHVEGQMQSMNSINQKSSFELCFVMLYLILLLTNTHIILHRKVQILLTRMLTKEAKREENNLDFLFMYNIMIWYLYTLKNDHHNNSSYPITIQRYKFFFL